MKRSRGKWLIFLVGIILALMTFSYFGNIVYRVTEYRKTASNQSFILVPLVVHPVSGDKVKRFFNDYDIVKNGEFRLAIFNNTTDLEKIPNRYLERTRILEALGFTTPGDSSDNMAIPALPNLMEIHLSLSAEVPAKQVNYLFERVGETKAVSLVLESQVNQETFRLVTRNLPALNRLILYPRDPEFDGEILAELAKLEQLMALEFKGHPKSIISLVENHQFPYLRTLHLDSIDKPLLEALPDFAPRLAILNVNSGLRQSDRKELKKVLPALQFSN